MIRRRTEPVPDERVVRDVAEARARAPIDNAMVADRFETVADLLEVDEESPFRIRAYRSAARVLRGWPRPVQDMVSRGEALTEIPGIGKDLAGKIAEIVTTGRLSLLEELEGRIEPGVAALLELRGIGPKRAKQIRHELGVGSLEALEAAARSGRLRELHGIGPKTEAEVLRAVQSLHVEGRRVPWVTAELVALALLEHLSHAPGTLRLEACGSFRRRKDTVGDLDVLVASSDPESATTSFLTFPQVERVLAHGPTRSAVELRSGLQVDLRVVTDESFGAALLYFTGSKAHNIAVRRLGVARGLKINEYGVFRGEDRIAGRTEEEVYATVGMAYVQPELREDRGEVEAALEGRLPALVELSHLRGDLHAHTSTSDGRDSIEAMARAAVALGREYLAISDPTQSLRTARGVDPVRFEKHLAEIERVRALVPKLRLLASAEVDVRSDGSLDLPEALLARLDVVVCAVHSRLDTDGGRLTRRIVKALEHPRCHVLAHPTGRVLGERPPAAVDVSAVIEAAKRHGVALEVDSQPLRLDLDDTWCRAAKEAGVGVVISSAARAVEELELLRLGVQQARRGWLERSDVRNTLTWPALRRRLRSPAPA
jgi:DNA polymerase (family 10)